jgi:hypothetical protein
MGTSREGLGRNGGVTTTNNGSQGENAWPSSP